MKTDYKKLIETLEFCIFGHPELALDVGGWNLHGDSKQTRYRLDGSDGGKSCKMRLGYYRGTLCLYYNGGSVTSKRVTKILEEKYGKRWMEIVCQMYGIRREDFPADDDDSTFKPRDYKHTIGKQTESKPKRYVIGDESGIDSIPMEIVSATYDRSRQNTLYNFLCRTFGEAKALQAWERYRVGNSYGGQTLFWCYDKQGRCRGGKMMSYKPDGHRRKENPYGTISIGADLKRRGDIPQDLNLKSSVFGEHLLSQFPLALVGVVESEKSALICSLVSRDIIWLATGGWNQNLDRIIALLKGRSATFFPDADKVKEWKEKFGTVRGFTVSEFCYDYFRKNGEKWSKADLADIIVAEYQQKAATA